MSQLTNIEVSDFKGLQSTDVEPGGLNVITGRNNSGKTSLLESIELCLSPRAVQKYQGNLHNLINVDSESSEIKASIGDENKTIELRRPSVEETREAVLQTIKKRLKMIQNRDNEYFPEFLSPETMDILISGFDDFADEFTSSLSGPELSRIQERTIVVIVNKSRYTYQHQGHWLRQIIRNGPMSFPEYLVTNFSLDDEGVEDLSQRKVEELTEEFLHLLFRYHTRGTYISDQQPPEHEVTYIEEPMMDERPRHQRPDKGDSVRKVRVRKFLNEWGIVENLEDFDFDELVFNRDGREQSIPYDFMGDGFKTIVGIIWEFVGEEELDDVILMEEPENHLHPGYINELVPFLIEIVEEEDAQLFITTHNVDFITEFFQERVESEYRSILEDEFNLMQMGGLFPKQFNYLEAEQQIEDIHNDLRGL